MAELTWSEFKVDLAQMRDAIGSVRRESDLIYGYMGQISAEFKGVKAAWVSPAELSFDDVQTWFTKASDDLHHLLEEMINRLQTSYDNYYATELANSQNLT